MATTPDISRMFYGQTNFMKLAFVRLLQAAFSHASTPPEYRWAPNNKRTTTPGSPIPAGGDPGMGQRRPRQGDRQLWIYRASPKRTTGLPAIYVEADPADASISMLGQEIERQVFEDGVLVADVYSGPIFITVKLTVVAKTTTDREILTDMVTGMVRVVFREKFLKEKIEYLDIQAGDAGEEGDNPENMRFFGEIKVKCQTQFHHYVDRSLADTVMAVNLDGIRYGTDDSDLTPCRDKRWAPSSPRTSRATTGSCWATCRTRTSSCGTAASSPTRPARSRPTWISTRPSTTRHSRRSWSSESTGGRWRGPRSRWPRGPPMPTSRSPWGPSTSRPGTGRNC